MASNDPSSDSRIREGLTFDDVLLVPARVARSCPRDVDVRTRAHARRSRSTSRSSRPRWTPSPSTRPRSAWRRTAASASSTRTCRSRAQAAEVDKVKRSESGMIVDPITMRPEQRDRRGARGDGSATRISGVPVTRDGKAGRHPHEPRPALREATPTGRDLERDDEGGPRHGAARARRSSARRSSSTSTASRSCSWSTSSGDLRGLITIKDIEKSERFPDAAQGRARPAALRRGGRRRRRTAERAQALVDAGVDVIVVDTAHGHSTGVLETVARAAARVPAISRSSAATSPPPRAPRR